MLFQSHKYQKDVFKYKIAAAMAAKVLFCNFYMFDIAQNGLYTFI